jgi:anti-anti-sigma factor
VFEPIAAFVELVDDAPVPTLHVGGELDVAVAGTLRDHLDLAIAAATGDVLIDLVRVTFLDSTTICELIRAHVALCNVGHGVVVADAAPVARGASRSAVCPTAFPSRAISTSAAVGLSRVARSTRTCLSTGAPSPPVGDGVDDPQTPAALGTGDVGHLRPRRVVVVELDP